MSGAQPFGHTADVAYDEELADRLREHLATEPDLTEKKMFGGLAFLLAGHMAVATSGQGGLLLRVDPTRAERLTGQPAAQPMVMRGRELTGWLHVEVDASVTDEELGRWVDEGVTFVRSLPPK